MDTNLAKSYCSDLYQVIIRQYKQEELGTYMKKIVEIQDMETLDQIYSFMDGVTTRITQYHSEKNTQKYSLVVNEMITCAHSNLHNANLSLTWIAKEVLFMNENYLGRLFSKETNLKFSQYVTDIRIQKAKELLNSSNEYKIYEICELIGFSDPQYFSQVFKKHTGLTPSDYKNTIRGD